MARRLTACTSLWDLIERRAEDTPDARFVIDEYGRTLTFAEYRDASQRAAAAFAARGIGEGDVVSWQLPTWIEAMVLVGGAGPARRGAEPDPADLPRARGRLRRARGRARSCSSCRAMWRGFDFGAMAEALGPTPTSGCCIAATLLDGDVAALPRPPGRRTGVHARRALRRSAALDLLHVGHDGRPEGRAAHRQHRRRGRLRDGRRVRPHRRRPQRARVPVHPHRRDQLADGRAHVGLRGGDRRGIRPGDHDPGARA